MTDTPTLRLDVWLWRARFFKTRALSGSHVRKRGVRLTRHGQTRRVNKPGTAICGGDVVTLARGAHIRTVEVLHLGTRRGPAEEAASLYRTLETDT
jgi:ribosome-associated heat shock protein Hsp15